MHPTLVRPLRLVFYVALAIGWAACGSRQSRSDLVRGGSLEVDMLVSAGNGVEVWFNDWQHSSERLPVVVGERHIYGFTGVPREIHLLRLDPTDVPAARIVLYSLTLKIGGRTYRRFGPAEVKKWERHNLSTPQEDGGGLAMTGATDDPILLTTLKLQLPAGHEGGQASSVPLYILLLLAVAVLLLVVLMRPARKPKPNWQFFVLEGPLTVLAVILGLWQVGNMAKMVREAWVPIPLGDDWDRWLTYVSSPNIVAWYFRQHIDHRLVWPKLLFEIDHWVFHAQGRFTLVCAFCLQVLTGILLWSLSRHVCPQERSERLMLASVMAACLFSELQWMNFTMPFQVVFPMLYCAATIAVVSLWRASQEDWRYGFPWLIGGIAAATVATYSMANGVLLWPIMLLAAFWLRMPRRWFLWLAGGAALFGISYFFNWRQMPYTSMPASERLHRAAIFLFANLGSPTYGLASRYFVNVNSLLAAAAVPGVLVALALLAGFVLLWLRRDRFNSARAMLIFYGVFLAASCATIAYGRSFENLTEAFTPRYLTPVYLLWICILTASWPVLRRIPHSALYAALCAAMYFGIVIHQRSESNIIREALNVRLGETAVVDNVTDMSAWHALYHTPGLVMDTVDYLRNNHLSIFVEEWTHWPGILLERRFLVDRNPDACQGQFELAVRVPTELKPGWRVNGWAWDVKADRPPRYVVLGDDAGRVAGVALTGFEQPPALISFPKEFFDSPWIGYVDGQPRMITAYVVEADERSLCAIGKQQIISSR